MLRKYAHLVDESLSELAAMKSTKRQYVLEALGCLAKFLGIYEDLKKRMRNHGLKWAGESWLAGSGRSSGRPRN